MSDLPFEMTDEEVSQARVVVVDDEELVTTTLRNFLYLELEISATTFNQPEEALNFIEKNPIDLTISDFLMPGLDGIKLLAGVRQHHPHAPRILLTGYADKENAIKAINQVQLYQYVEKPWDNAQFGSVIRNALERRHLIRFISEQLEKLAKTEKDLVRLRKGLMRAFA